MKMRVVLALALCLGACHRGPGRGADLDGGTSGGDAGAHGAITSLAVVPAVSTLSVTDPTVLPSASLAAVATFADGTTGPVTASWSLDRYDIAQVGVGSGVVSAVGNAYGAATITASAGSVTASGTVNVSLSLVVTSGPVDPAVRTKLDLASATDPLVAGLLYPYDRTVFPRALLAPELMWSGGVDTDLYRVHMTGGAFDFTYYGPVVNPSRYTLDQALWTALGASAAPGTVTVDLHRLDGGGNAYASATQTWTLANANLRGTIYYWAVNQGQLVTLDVSTGARQLTFDSGAFDQLGTPAPVDSSSPLSPPWESNGANKRCVACHAVSKDGSTLTSIFARGGSNGPTGSVSLATQAISSVSDYQVNGIYTSLTPDGRYAAVNDAAKHVRLIDTATGAAVTTELDGVANLCDPAFSPDGTLFAIGSSCDPGFGYPIEYRTASLTVYDFAEATHSFTNPRVVVTSAGIGDAIAFPSFSPDSKSIFFQRGDYSRAKYTTGTTNTHGHDDLWVVPVAANATAIKLDAVNGTAYLGASNQQLNYNPTVNPIAEGGYAWVVFTTPRDYGNRMRDTSGNPTYGNHKQLWVGAVDLATGAADPSHPAFWLPGQDETSVNMFGYWALSVCKPTAATSSCAAGYECCSGFCRDTGAGPSCVDAPTGCHQTGEKCTTTADCCNAASGDSCTGGFCQGTSIN